MELSSDMKALVEILPDEIRTSLYGLYEKDPSLVSKVEGVLSAQVAARLTPLQTELQTKQRDLDAQFDTLASIRGNDGVAIAAAEGRIEKLAAERAVLEARLRNVAGQAGLDADELLKDIAKEPAVQPQPKIDSSFDPTQLLKQVNQVGLNAAEQAFLMEDIASEHQQLFGKPMSRGELWNEVKETVKRTGNVNLGLRDVWERKYDVGKKRDEIRERDVQQRIDAAVAAAKTAQMDELALRSQSHTPVNPMAEQSPFFKSMTGKEGVTPVQLQSAVPESVRAAMADFAKRRSERKAG